MKNKTKYLLLLSATLIVGFSSCKKSGSDINPPVTTPPPPPAPPTGPVLPTTLSGIKAILVDKNATDETAALFYNMKVLARTKIMFGHQDDTKQGFNWNGEAGRSDVKEVTGAYPAVYGWDMLFVASFQRNSWFDGQVNMIRQLTKDAYKRGGVNTYCWHYWNPALSKRPGQDGSTEGTNADFYYKNAPAAAVPEILPGGSYNAVYNQSLDQVADQISSLKDDNGKPIPIIFRLFHEQDGDWFWWGAKYCTAQQYKDLFQYTVKYLRDAKKLHNILFSWSPDRGASTEADYLARYPGNDYVDVLGIDEYYDLSADRGGAAGITAASNKIKIMSDYAKANNKIAAVTETGLSNLTKPDWYTTVLLPALTQQKVEISYALAWGNSSSTYWTPYQGGPSAVAADFVKFKNTSNIVFGDTAPDMYKIK
ncbi:mannan endo-1,4-beta-mannosidase [Pedobacter sp. UYP30]|uniref:glycoside hydrolase family 26 protein n=1 Tax=Pedobacter sp. UYP30 TaxID=1756400 RepID=UPI0033972601